MRLLPVIGGKPVSRVLVGALALLAAGTSSALAIPSPELVVGSLSSISQLIALVSALLGGGAVVVGVKARGGMSGASGIAVKTALGVIAVLIIMLGTLAYLYVAQQNAERARLEATLTRPVEAVAGKSLDPTLKEVSYSEQIRNRRGISTGELEKLLFAKQRGEQSDYVLLDIRETAETEMGSLPGSQPIRFPDLRTSKLDFAGKKPIVFCHDGNRGYETCMALAAMGIDCRFLVGGLEKWLAENRSLAGLNARAPDDLRALRPYRNQSVMLNTRQVRDLVDNKEAVFVDPRYPGEFVSSSLPDAINLPIRSTSTTELKQRLSELPKTPIISPCYDARSCFFSEVLGLELDRMGHDYRGRYTVPWEYFSPNTPRPYIEQWLEQGRKSWWTKASEYLLSALAKAADHVGLIGAIFLLALVSRLLVLPVAWKAERDQIVARQHEDEMKDLKTRLKGDPRLARAMRAFYRRYGLTPIRNLLGLLFLPIMALSVGAVHTAATISKPSLLWIPDLSERDPWLVLPVLFAVLFAIYCDLAFGRSKGQRALIWIAAVTLLTIAGTLLSAAADLYIVFTAVLLLVQRTLVSGAFGRLAASIRRRRLGAGVVPLSEPELLPGCGNKAYRLARMRQEGIPVPDGVVLTQDFLTDFASSNPEVRRPKLDRVWRAVGAEKLVVRSSAAAEDGAQHSFAGVFESVLNVDRAGLESAIAKVMASFNAGRVKSYGVERGGGSIVVQRMVDAQFAGVLFTQDPAAGGLSMVELVEGTAEGLVSGAVAPQTFRLGRVSGGIIGEAQPPIDLVPLIRLGRRAEQIFGAAQDIEWTYRDGEFYLVQSRDITRLLEDSAGNAGLRGEYARVLERAAGAGSDEVVFAQNELAEMLPRPTPLSLLESMWASGGSVDVACRTLGIRYGVEEDAPSYLTTIFGRLYIDKRQERVRAGRISALAIRRLNKSADKIEREFRDKFLPDYSREMALREAVDFDRLATPDLIATLKQMHEDFVHRTHVEVDVINVAASFYFDRTKKLLAEHGLDPTAHLGHVPETDYDRVLAQAAQLQGSARREFLIAQAGHRAVLDYELASPRYAEAPDPIEALCRAEAQPSHSPGNEVAEDAALDKAGKAVAEAARVACRFERLKEDAKHHSLRELAVIRRAVLALDRRFGLENLVFYLTMEELLTLPERPVEAMRDLATERYHQSLQFMQAAPLPPTLTIRELEKASAGIEEHTEAGGEIRGTRVSGAGMVSGRARVVSAANAESGGPIPNFADGDIVVSSMVHPAWLPFFGRAGGFVCAVGGWLSHTAILAREHNLVMIVGARGLDAIPDASELRLHLDGTVEIVEDAAESREIPPSLAAE
jgi:phosphoenolpyruvate synthase/pyruvate phosphate dikinase/rhodanese-related sulfurtransferase/membrane protein insertase Oxa1/YidC/SpoIIIJ